MRRASAPMLFLIGLLVAAVIGGATFGIGALVGLGDDDDDGDDAAAADTTLPPEDVVLAANQVSITGVATTIAVVDAQLAEIAIPAVTSPELGAASAQFEAAIVDGEDSAIAWDAGRPLVFGAETPLRLDPAPMSLLANQAAIVLAWVDGSVHQVLPGDYAIEAPVAVSTGGLASPHDRVDFSANDGTTVAFTGAAASTLAAQPLTVTGPGQVILEGALRITHPDGRIDDATRVELPTGSFRLSLSPRADGGGYDLTDVLLEGPIAVA